MKKKIILFFTAICIVGMLITTLVKMFAFQSSQNSRVVINNQTFFVSLAKNDKERETGLSQTKSLAPNAGMLFLFENAGYYQFWMHNMTFAIDIIFIKDDRVVEIFSDVPYPKTPHDNLPIYAAASPANYVLEISAGIAKKYNIKKGDKAEIVL